jgi:hypothetical protein
LISNFCCVLNVVCFLLGNSPESEFYMMFRNTLSVPPSQATSLWRWNRQCSEMSYTIQMLGNYPEESIKQAPPYLVNETNLVHNLFLVYFISFIYNLYMFWTFPGPSSGGTIVFMQHLVLVILYSCILYILQTRQSAIQNNKYHVSHKYSCYSWWGTWKGPRHV